MQGLTEPMTAESGVRLAPVRRVAPRSLTTNVRGPCHFGFLVFLLVNLNLFLRPTELIPALDGYPIYEISILLALVFSAPVILPQLSWKALKATPITLTVLLLIPATFLASASHGDLWSARYNALDIFKVTLYYLLLVGLVCTPKRLRQFVLFTFFLLALMALFVLLHYYGFIGNNQVAAVSEAFTTDADGNRIFVDRVQGLGIFEDPNDLSLVMVMAVMIGVHFVIRAQAAERMMWITPIGLILCTFEMTHSRGGFLSMVAATFTAVVARLGWKKGILCLVLCSPLVIPFLDARQTDLAIGDKNDTGQGRIHLWRDSLFMMHQHPVFGIGVGQLAELNGLVAHNSFVQAYAETGLVGGTIFVAMFFFCINRLLFIRRSLPPNSDPELAPWAPTLLAIIIGYAVGLFSLTRNGVVPTFFPPGLVCAYASICARRYPLLDVKPTRRTIRHVVALSIVSIVALELIVRFMAF
jgi:O-antigen ligase